MGTVDFDSETGDTWARMVHDMTRRNPRALRYRPAVDRREQLLADEVNRHMERVIVGYERREGDMPPELACHRCGSGVGPLVNVGAVYARGVRVDRYRCADYCEEATA